jgi:hypothetical protein
LVPVRRYLSTGLTPGLTDVILRKRPGSRGSLFRDRTGANVLSGGESNWSRRYKAYLEKLASGDLVQVVQVVRDLAERDASRGLSAAEKRMLARARLILLQEG